MRTLLLVSILLCVKTGYTQSEFRVNYLETNYQQFIKHPKTEFKDSLSLIRYMNDLRLEAIRKGYLLASVDQISFHNRIATVSMYIGPVFSAASVSIDPHEIAFIRRNSRLNERFITQLDITPGALASAFRNIRDAYLENGYPFVSIHLDSLQFDEANLSAHLVIDRGPHCTWKQIHVKGDSSLSVQYISALIGIKKRDEYDESRLKQISNRIEQVAFLEEIRPHELLFTKEGVELFVYAKQRAVSSVNGIVGFQPNPDDKIQFTGDVNLKLLNVLKRGELLAIRWQSIRDQTQSLKSKLNYPFLFKSPFGINSTFNLYKRDTSFLELNLSAGVQYSFSQGSYLTAFYNRISSNVLSGGANNPSFSSLSSTESNNYGLSLQRQQLDYLPNPSKGYTIFVTGSAGIRKSRENDSSQLITDQVFRGQVLLEKYIPIYRRHIFRVAGDFNFYNAPEIFENELTRFGGLGSQRGFNEDELTATTVAMFVFEYRFLLDRNSHIFAFFDQTLYENAASNYYQDEPFGFGVGFSFSTNLGVFSISYALGKQFDNTIQFSNGKVHFGYIAYF